MKRERGDRTPLPRTALSGRGYHRAVTFPAPLPPQRFSSRRDGWLTVLAAAPHHDRWLVTIEGIDDRSAAQRFTNVPIYAEPIDDPDELWVHELIGSMVTDVHGRDRGRCVAVVANPASDLLELESGALVPVVFVVRHADGVVVIDPPEGLFDDDRDAP